LACRIAAAQVEVMRVRRARADLLSIMPLEAITRALALSSNARIANKLAKKEASINEPFSDDAGAAPQAS
jgi:hypothetical protein